MSRNLANLRRPRGTPDGEAPRSREVLLDGQESVEEVAAALQRDAQVLGGGVLAARPLIFQPGPCLREGRSQLSTADDTSPSARCTHSRGSSTKPACTSFHRLRRSDKSCSAKSPSARSDSSDVLGVDDVGSVARSVSAAGGANCCADESSYRPAVSARGADVSTYCAEGSTRCWRCLRIARRGALALRGGVCVLPGGVRALRGRLAVLSRRCILLGRLVRCLLLRIHIRVGGIGVLARCGHARASFGVSCSVPNNFSNSAR